MHCRREMKSQKRRSCLRAKQQTRQSRRWHIQDTFNGKAWENRSSGKYYWESFPSERSQLIQNPNSPLAWIFRLPMEQRMFHWEIGGHNLRFIWPPRSYCVGKSQRKMHTKTMLIPMARFCQREKWSRCDFFSDLWAHTVSICGGRYPGWLSGDVFRSLKFSIWYIFLKFQEISRIPHL